MFTNILKVKYQRTYIRTEKTVILEEIIQLFSSVESTWRLLSFADRTWAIFSWYNLVIWTQDFDFSANTTVLWHNEWVRRALALNVLHDRRTGFVDLYIFGTHYSIDEDFTRIIMHALPRKHSSNFSRRMFLNFLKKCFLTVGSEPWTNDRMLL